MLLTKNLDFKTFKLHWSKIALIEFIIVSRFSFLVGMDYRYNFEVFLMLLL